MSRKIIPILAASLLAAASMSGVAYAKGGGNGGGNGGGHGGGHGSADHGGASGHAGGSDRGKQAAATDHGKSATAPGRLKGDDENAKAFAPGQAKQASKHADDDMVDDEVASIDDAEEVSGKLNFGTVISSIRAGKMDLTGVDDTTTVDIVDVAGLIKGNNRVALENALADDQDEITTLHDDLTALNLTALQGEDINDVVAVSRADDGSLTVFVDHSD